MKNVISEKLIVEAVDCLKEELNQNVMDMVQELLQTSKINITDADDEYELIQNINVLLMERLIKSFK